ncbi:hypothetical protein ACE6H2_023703 [Prunus campanulata]
MITPMKYGKKDTHLLGPKEPTHDNQLLRREPQAMQAEDVEKLVNDRLQDLKIRVHFEYALRKEVDQVTSSLFTIEIEQAAPPKQFSTPSFTHFKGNSDPKNHLKHFKSVMILYKAEDALMCKVTTYSRTADQSPKEASQSSDKPISKNYGGKRKAPSQGCASADEGYTKFTIPIHQILAQVKDML